MGAVRDRQSWRAVSPRSGGPAAAQHLLQAVDRRWQRAGVSRTDRAALVDQLRMDLLAAHAERPNQHTPAQLLGTDPAQFADDLAHAAGAAPRPVGPTGLWRSATIGGALGALVVYLGVYDGTQLFPEQVSLVVVYAYYTALGVCFVSAVLIAVWLGTRPDPLALPTLRRIALLLPLSAALSLPLAIGVAHLSNFVIRPFPNLAETGIVLTIAAAAVQVAHRTAARTTAA